MIRAGAIMLIRVFRTLVAVLVFGANIAAVAEVVPMPTGGDPHIQTVAYDPQEVVALRVSPGFATTVILSPDERIETVTVGDSSGWQVQVNRRADQLVVKPVGMPSATNLTVISDQRSYNFLLSTAAAEYGVQPYLVRFTYAAASGEEAKGEAVRQTPYRLTGAKLLRPTAMYDDGQTTSIVWPPSQRMPAVYIEMSKGKLALVNGVVRDGAFVVEGVFRKFVFLLGSKQAQAVRLEDVQGDADG